MSLSQSLFLEPNRINCLLPWHLDLDRCTLSSHFAKGWDPEMKDAVTAQCNNQHSISPPHQS